MLTNYVFLCSILSFGTLTVDNKMLMYSDMFRFYKFLSSFKFF